MNMRQARSMYRKGYSDVEKITLDEDVDALGAKRPKVVVKKRVFKGPGFRAWARKTLTGGMTGKLATIAGS